MLTVIPAYVYFVSFLFEQAMCNWYGIPSYLIDISLTTILLFGTTLWTVIFSCVKLMGLVVPMFKAANDETRPHLRMIFILNGLCLIIAIILLFSFPFSWLSLSIIVGVIASMNLFLWGIPLLTKIREKKSIKEKLVSISDEEDRFDLINLLLKRLSHNDRLLVGILIIIPGLSYFIGMGQAMKQEKYEVVTSMQNVIVLRKYGDLLVCSNYKSDNNLIGDSLILIRISDDPPLVLATKNLGRMQRGVITQHSE